VIGASLRPPKGPAQNCCPQRPWSNRSCPPTPTHHGVPSKPFARHRQPASPEGDASRSCHCRSPTPVATVPTPFLFWQQTEFPSGPDGREHGDDRPWDFASQGKERLDHLPWIICQKGLGHFRSSLTGSKLTFADVLLRYLLEFFILMAYSQFHGQYVEFKIFLDTSILAAGPWPRLSMKQGELLS